MRHPVVFVDTGLVGLTVALDLAQRGVAALILDDDDTVSIGPHAICFAKRALKIFSRMGLGAQFLAKGITWHRGSVFHGAGKAFNFDLLLEKGHKFPAFVNLKQHYA